MKSLEFIKQHVTEWPRECWKAVRLSDAGVVVFYTSKVPPPYDTLNLSEHFAPDYYDGKVYTREEFESFGVEKSEPNWNDAPDWATCYGTVGSHNAKVWYDSERYSYINQPERAFKFNQGNFNYNQAQRVASRQVTSEPTPNDGAKYEATIIGLCGTPVKIDIYRVLDAYPQVDPHIEHLIKKALKPGQRGHKDKRTDYLNIIESAQKALKLLDQKESLS